MKQGLSLTWDSQSRQGWLIIEPQESSLLGLTTAEFTTTTYQGQLLSLRFWGGVKLRSLGLQSKHFTHETVSPTPVWCFHVFLSVPHCPLLDCPQLLPPIGELEGFLFAVVYRYICVLCGIYGYIPAGMGMCD